MAVSFEVDFFPTPTVLMAEFEMIANKVRSFREPLERSVDQVVIPAIGLNFDEGGRPTWEELSDATLEKRQSSGFDSQPLVLTGTLRTAATAKARWQITSDDAFVINLPNSAWYGIVQHDGIVTSINQIPARPFFDVTEEEVDEIEEIFVDWINRQFMVHGF